MNFKNTTLQKIIPGMVMASMIIPSIFLSMPVKKAEAQTGVGVPVANPIIEKATGTSATLSAQEKFWRTVTKEVAMIAARRVLSRITQATVNWINGGFHGKPLYVENSKSFFTDIAKTEFRNMVDMFGYDSLRYPFGKDFARNIMNSYQSQLATNAQYSLSKVINDPVLLKSYRTNFNTGGWGGFLANTQFPQNNYIGFQMMATEELARKVAGLDQTLGQKVQSTLAQAQGFLAPQTCPSNPAYNNMVNEFQRPSFKPTTPYKPPTRDQFATEEAWAQASFSYEAQYRELERAEKEVWAQTNTCPKGLVTTTPGSVVANQIMTAMSSKYRQNELAAAMGNSLSAIFDALLNQLMSQGLKALTDNPVGDDWTAAPLGAAGSGNGGCVVNILQQTSEYKNDVLAAQAAALAHDPELAEKMADPTNVVAFTDLVIMKLQDAGFEAVHSTNGNCNKSPNNVGFRKPGEPYGEIYDVVREDPDNTVKDASGSTLGRPSYTGHALWDFVSNGTGGGGTTTPTTPTTTNPNITINVTTPTTTTTTTTTTGSTGSTGNPNNGPQLFGVKNTTPIGTAATPPTDSLQRHPAKLSLVQQAKADVIASGKSTAGDCGAFEIVKRAVELIGAPTLVDGVSISIPVGFVNKSPATDWNSNCFYKEATMIAFSDGYVVQILSGPTNTPTWVPKACYDPLHPYWLNVLRWGGRSDYPGALWTNINVAACPTLYRVQYDAFEGGGGSGDNGGIGGSNAGGGSSGSSGGSGSSGSSGNRSNPSTEDEDI